jgi:hypothetical protein
MEPLEGEVIDHIFKITDENSEFLSKISRKIMQTC